MAFNLTKLFGGNVTHVLLGFSLVINITTLALVAFFFINLNQDAFDSYMNRNWYGCPAFETPITEE